MKNNEVWLPVLGYENFYEVSNFGKVRSINRFQVVVKHEKEITRYIKGKELKQYKEKLDYRSVCLSKNNKKRTLCVHKLVAEAFLDKKSNCLHVCHNNGISSDNRLENLRYDTPSENTKDQSRHGRRRLSQEEVRAIRYYYQEEGYSIKYLSSFFKYDQGSISRIVRYHDGFYNHIPQEGKKIIIPQDKERGAWVKKKDVLKIKKLLKMSVSYSKITSITGWKKWVIDQVKTGKKDYLLNKEAS